MPTLKQKKLAKALIENLEADKPRGAGEILESVGYSPATAKGIPGVIIESEGVQEALEEYGFTEDNAKLVVSEIMLNGDVDPSARLKATDQVFKVKGSYAPEKHANLNVNIKGETEQKANEALKRFLEGK